MNPTHDELQRAALTRRQVDRSQQTILALRANGLPERRALKYAVRAAAACVADYGVTGSHLTAELEVIRVEAGNDGEYQPG